MSLLCKIPSSACFPFAILAEQADLFREAYRGRGMSVAVPIILAVALAVSLYGQAGWNWPNYQAEQNEKSAKSGDDSSKDKSGKTDEGSSEKGKSGQKNSSGKSAKGAAVSKGRGDAGTKRQE